MVREIVWPFKRKPKIIRHELVHVTDLPQHKDFYRAVKCKNCGKQFVMDVFGGWAVEWNFKIDENMNWKVDQQNFAEAINHIHSKRPNEWIQLGYTDVCEGKEG